jgi:hypothetical protein
MSPKIASRWNRLAGDVDPVRERLHVLIQESGDENRSATRRNLLRATVLGSAGAILGAVVTVRAQQKMPKQAAEYQDTPKGILMCATCSLFQPPRSCKVVEGDVAPEGWCKAFDLAD